MSSFCESLLEFSLCIFILIIGANLGYLAAVKQLKDKTKKFKKKVKKEICYTCREKLFVYNDGEIEE